MRAGRLRSLVTLQERTLVPNEYGELDESWADVSQIYAEIQAQSGAGIEGIISQREDAARTHTITLRPLAFEIKSHKHRIVYQDRVFDIDGPQIDPVNRGFRLELAAIEHIAAARPAPLEVLSAVISAGGA